MPIVYALIARKKAVLAEYTCSSGNFPTVTRVLLGKIPEQDGKMSYVYDQHVFHYIVDGGMTFLCMATEDTKRRLTFAFLDDIMKLWREKYGSVEQSALAFSLNDLFAPILKQRMVSTGLNECNRKKLSPNRIASHLTWPYLLLFVARKMSIRNIFRQVRLPIPCLWFRQK